MLNMLQLIIKKRLCRSLKGIYGCIKDNLLPHPCRSLSCYNYIICECFPKLWVEYCVDDEVEVGVNIAKEGGNIEGNVAMGGVEVILDIAGIKDVAGETEVQLKIIIIRVF
jgi:hypothetical protein